MATTFLAQLLASILPIRKVRGPAGGTSQCAASGCPCRGRAVEFAFSSLTSILAFIAETHATYFLYLNLSSDIIFVWVATVVASYPKWHVVGGSL